MPQQTVNAYQQEMRRLSPLVGDAVTTTADTLGLDQASSSGRIEYLELQGRNYSTAVAVGYALNPYLVVLKTTDNQATYTDYSNAAQDNDAADDVVLSSLSTYANGDMLFVGSHIPFRGVAIDVDAANGTASVLTVKYWNGSDWVDISDTDGTISTGVSLAQDGNVTWTVPAAWKPTELWRKGNVNNQVTEELADSKAQRDALTPYVDPLYWTRWEWSVALDSSTTLNSMHALNRSTNYASIVSGQVVSRAARVGYLGYGSIEHITDAGTANLIVNGGSGKGTF